MCSLHNKARRRRIPPPIVRSERCRWYSIPAKNNSVKNNARARLSVSASKQGKRDVRTNSTNGEPHCLSFQGSSHILSSFIKNRRWKLRSLLRPGNSRCIVSWSIVFDCAAAVAYRCETDPTIRQDACLSEFRSPSRTCIVSRSCTYFRSVCRSSMTT